MVAEAKLTRSLFCRSYRTTFPADCNLTIHNLNACPKRGILNKHCAQQPQASHLLFYEAIERSSERGIVRAIQRAIERSSEPSSDRAIEQSLDRASDRAIERASDRAVERSNARRKRDALNSSSRSPFDTLTSSLCSSFQRQFISKLTVAHHRAQSNFAEPLLSLSENTCSAFMVKTSTMHNLFLWASASKGRVGGRGEAF